VSAKPRDQSDTPTPPTIYPPRDLARLAYAQACRELSDSARCQVATTADSYAHPGEYVEAARRLVNEADWALTRAVVFERQAGRSWATIAEALGVSAEAAQERFGQAELDWKAALVRPLRPHRYGGYLVSALPDGADGPEDYVRWLDDWCARHTETTDVAAYRPAEERAHQVSAGLTAHRDPDLAVTGEIGLVLAQARQLAQQPGRQQHAGELRAFHERKSRLLEAIAALGQDPDAAELAAGARRQLEALADPSAPTTDRPLPDHPTGGARPPQPGWPLRQETDRER
jgi:hypothetical protein